MDEDFDLYGDADIYGTTEVKEDEDQQKRTQEQLSSKPPAAGAQEAASNAAAAAAPPNRGSDNQATGHQGYAGNQGQSGYNAGSTSGQYGSQYSARPPQQAPAPAYPNNGDASEPSAARVGLAGRPKVVDPNVQNALYVGELDWWVSDEEIRKIANDIGIPVRLSDVTFSEHKVNGKSKGIAFVETADDDEARRLKAWFESNDINHKRATVTLATSASGNPFKTLPKDPPPRENRPMRGGGRGGMAMGAREGGRREGGNMPMAGAPMRMGGQNSGQGGNMAAAAMMNPMMMGMMGGAGRGGFGRGGGRPPMGGMGHFNPNFFGGGGGGGGGRGGYNNSGGGGGYNNGGGDDRERKRYRSDDNY